MAVSAKFSSIFIGWLLLTFIATDNIAGIVFPKDSIEVQGKTFASTELFENLSSGLELKSSETYSRFFPNSAEKTDKSLYYYEPKVSLETEEFLNDSEPKDKEGNRIQGWNYVDNSDGNYVKHEKTISLQYLDDDGGYTHSPPAWPHDEYLLQFPQQVTNGYGTRNFTPSETSDSDIGHIWKKLKPQPSNSVFIGPGFHEATQPAYQAITDLGATVISSSDADASNAGGQVPNAVSESSNSGKYHPGSGVHPYDYYRRKRLRLKIHPGLLAAPIAGYAAYKAISAIAKKPLMFELGWVNNKPNLQIGGGGGWAQTPVYPPPVTIHRPYPPIIQPVHVPVVTQGPYYPILRPKKRPERARYSWWNPFAALTPRFLRKKQQSCCPT